jgi:hypothetical protein
MNIAVSNSPASCSHLSLFFVTIKLIAGKEVKPSIVTIQKCPICEKEAYEVYWFVHEQADDEADGVLQDSC